MKKVLTIVGVVLVIAVAGIVLFSPRKPNKEDFAHLKEPRIVQKANANSLQVSFQGDPEQVIGEAFGKLMKAYFSLKGAPKGKDINPPIARYEGFDESVTEMSSEELRQIEWKGYAAIPIPEEITRVDAEGVEVKTLQYGTVAEVVHFGAYEDETPLIKRLKSFIKDQGYRIIGPHEEEYILGPGMPGVKKEDYITIIRYQIEKG